DVFVFFFQAEDGIRDRNVTGVQTCALPIYQYQLHGCKLKREQYGHIVIYVGDVDGVDSIAHASIYSRVAGIGPSDYLDDGLVDRSEERRVGKERSCSGGVWRRIKRRGTTKG